MIKMISCLFQVEQITAEYKALALQYHPDKNEGNKEAEAKFQQLKVIDCTQGGSNSFYILVTAHKVLAFAFLSECQRNTLRSREKEQLR